MYYKLSVRICKIGSQAERGRLWENAVQLKEVKNIMTERETWLKDRFSINDLRTTVVLMNIPEEEWNRLSDEEKDALAEAAYTLSSDKGPYGEAAAYPIVLATISVNLLQEIKAARELTPEELEAYGNWEPDEDSWVIAAREDRGIQKR